MDKNIEISAGLLQSDKFYKWLGSQERQIAVISDRNIAPLYAEDFVAKLVGNGFSARLFTFSAGEKYKVRKTIDSLQDQLFEWGLDRYGLVVAMGGGVVTDVAGYTAATFMRGVEFINIPTTLLAMVDASIGGKTGVNTSYGKNLVGAFWMPKAVLIDSDVLQTLPKSCLLEGVVEMLKHGLVADKNYFEMLVECSEKVLQLDPKTLEKVIRRSCEIKTSIVSEDLYERQGKRKTLNFGHTVGHAIELVSNYTIGHGAAVAIGIIAEMKIARDRGLLSEGAINRARDAFDRYGIDTAMPSGITVDSLKGAMRHDKKTKNGTINFVLLRDIGCCAYQ